ncbi:hypothetical protein IMCC1989_1286 [gamma proteobacterium IMCC1989]|nr:hypothetical protein IMCC1989_1286 [gamma proteobacterium IMCC1989]
MTQEKVIIVGGGVVSILTAILYAQKKHDVTIIEKEKNLGGLLSSFTAETGATFDYGTHIPGKTGITELDNILFGNQHQEEENYYRSDYLKSENFFNGEWFKTSPLINTASLPQDLYNQGIIELLTSTGSDEEQHLHSYLTGHFGETLTNHVYKPVIQKLLGEAPDNLSIEVLRTFGLQRLIGLTNEDTIELKKIPKYDSRLGYHSYTQGSPSNYYLYPKGANGIGQWVNDLLAKAEELGVKIMHSTSVIEIHHENNVLNSVSTSEGSSIDCNQLIWSIATPLAYKCANIPFPKTGSPPKFRTTVLAHMQFDRPLEKNFPQYLLCWDPDFLSYRITLYPNISPDSERNRMNNLTVEILTSAEKASDIDTLKETIYGELKQLQVISESANITYDKIQVIKNTFPVLTPEFIESASNLSDKLEESVKGIKVIGRASGKAFFINDLLSQAYKRFA